MRSPARLLLVLAWVAAAHVAAAAGRFVPADPHFVVANVRQALPDAALRELIASWRAAPDEASSAALAAAFLDRAGSLREPMYIGRAEAVLAPVAVKPQAAAELRRLYAETLQFRHEFTAAEALLDDILRVTPFDAAARQQRASVRLVRGEFAGARADCARLLGGGGVQAVALACLAEAMAGGGQLTQALGLLAAYPIRRDESEAARAYLLSVRAELYERDADPVRAINDYRAALALAPTVDSIRAALADALVARGASAEAAQLLDIERPSLALAVRRAACTVGQEQQQLRARTSAWLDLEAARGDAPHLREAALLALDVGEPERALHAAQANFRLQRELPDVRALARAAIAARDHDAQRELQAWLRDSGFRDSVTESILVSMGRG